MAAPLIAELSMEAVEESSPRRVLLATSNDFRAELKDLL